MCVYASFIVRPGGIVNWTESDSHEVCIQRLGLVDNNQFLCHFVRVEVPRGRMIDYTTDEPGEYLPAWYTEHESEYQSKVGRILTQLNTARQDYYELLDASAAEMQKLSAQYAADREVYNHEIAEARAKFDEQLLLESGWPADTEDSREAAWAHIQPLRDAMHLEYEKKFTALNLSRRQKRNEIKNKFGTLGTPSTIYERIEGYVPTNI